MMRIPLQTASGHTHLTAHFITHTCDREIIIPLCSQCENLILDQCRRVNTFDPRCYQTLDFVLVSKFLVIKKKYDTYCLSVRIGEKKKTNRLSPWVPNSEFPPNTTLFSTITKPVFSSILATIHRPIGCIFIQVIPYTCKETLGKTLVQEYMRNLASKTALP